MCHMRQRATIGHATLQHEGYISGYGWVRIYVSVNFRDEGGAWVSFGFIKSHDQVSQHAHLSFFIVLHLHCSNVGQLNPIPNRHITRNLTLTQPFPEKSQYILPLILVYESINVDRSVYSKNVCLIRKSGSEVLKGHIFFQLKVYG